MIPALKSEIRKLLTVRSTYVIFGISLVFVAFFAGYVEGYKVSGMSASNPGKLASEVTGAVANMSIFGALIALLLFAHEYRYNTIMYTLTAANRRTKVLLAKIITVSLLALVFTAVMAAFGPLATAVGLQIKGVDLAPQVFYYRDLIPHALFFGWGYAMAGLLLISLIRNQIGAIVTLFIVSSTVEAVLSLLLKKDAVYLPFQSLSQVLGQPTMGGGSLSPGKAMLVFSSYLIVGWLVAWALFLRRDAN